MRPSFETSVESAILVFVVYRLLVDGVDAPVRVDRCGGSGRLAEEHAIVLCRHGH